MVAMTMAAVPVAVITEAVTTMVVEPASRKDNQKLRVKN
jgi:hypothetical protein